MASGRDVAAFNRQDAITDIKLVLRRLRVTHCLALLTKYGLPETRKIGQFHEDYLPARLSAASDHQLAALTANLKANYAKGSALSDKYCSLLDQTQLRLFISHAPLGRREAQSLKLQLALAGLTAFTSGEDVITNQEWLVETVAQLEHMDGLLNLVTDQSLTSPAANQEVGFALGAGVPVLNIIKELPPQGLAGSMQMIEWGEEARTKSVALDVIGWMMDQPALGPKLTDLLVRQIVSSGEATDAYRIIGFCRHALKRSKHLLAGQIFELRQAARDNPEIARFASGRGPEMILTLCDEWEDQQKAS